MTSMLSIVPLSIESWDALSDLFSAGGDPKWCCCSSGESSRRIARVGALFGLG
jgi:hypothetical protein